MLDELKAAEAIYRDSVADITHNHIRILGSPRLWKTMLDSAVTGWSVRGVVDAAGERRFERTASNPCSLALPDAFRLRGKSSAACGPMRGGVGTTAGW